MLFSSLGFLFCFLPMTLAAVCVAMRLKGRRAALAVLLAASLIFYAWQTPSYIFLIGASILVNYAFGRRILKRGSKKTLALGVAFNLALLGWFKYIGLFSSTLSDLAHVNVTVDGVVLPLAISFFTFQQIAYLCDCLKDEGRGYSLLDYALFVAFFPQLIAGPIVHHKEVTPQFSGDRFARFKADDLAAGVFLFSIGLAKKVLVADGLAPLADGVFDAAGLGLAIPPVEAWAGLIAYSFQIYFDFSGYSDMALGLALMYGVKLPMNFNSPYKARSIVDFWRRWHITLSRFLRDYLYIPLGGNRKGGLLRYRNLFIVMLLGGLWHGAAWTFMVWGGLHGAYLCLNHFWDRAIGDRYRLPPSIAVLMTFLAASLAWVFFRAESFPAAFAMLGALSGAGAGAASVLSSTELYAYPLIGLAALIVWGAPNALELLERFKTRAPAPGANAGGPAMALVQHRALLMALLGAAAALSVFILMTSGPYEFIYFQF